jgi:hypothetical protein
MGQLFSRPAVDNKPKKPAVLRDKATLKRKKQGFFHSIPETTTKSFTEKYKEVYEELILQAVEQQGFFHSISETTTKSFTEKYKEVYEELILQAVEQQYDKHYKELLTAAVATNDDKAVVSWLALLEPPKYLIDYNNFFNVVADHPRQDFPSLQDFENWWYAIIKYHWYDWHLAAWTSKEIKQTFENNKQVLKAYQDYIQSVSVKNEGTADTDSSASVRDSDSDNAGGWDSDNNSLESHSNPNLHDNQSAPYQDLDVRPQEALVLHNTYIQYNHRENHSKLRKELENLKQFVKEAEPEAVYMRAQALAREASMAFPL